MSLDTPASATALAPLPMQFVNIEITPLVGGEFSVLMQATLLDEEALELIAQDLANERVQTIEDALAVIRNNVSGLAPAD
jgi:hypothetical protein